MKGKMMLRAVWRAMQAEAALAVGYWLSSLVSGTDSGAVFSMVIGVQEAVAAMAGLTLAVCGIWNVSAAFAGMQDALARAEQRQELRAARPDRFARGPLTEADAEAFRRSLAPVMTSMSSLRYLGPPPGAVAVFEEPARSFAGRTVHVLEGGAVWAQDSPAMSRGTCGKCGEPMAHHLYYGKDPCRIMPEAVLAIVQPRRCDGCGGQMLLFEVRGGRRYCTRCMTG